MLVLLINVTSARPFSSTSLTKSWTSLFIVSDPPQLICKRQIYIHIVQRLFLKTFVGEWTPSRLFFLSLFCVVYARQASNHDIIPQFELLLR